MALAPKRARAPFARLLRWLADEAGNIGPLLALMVVPIVGAFAIGGETSSWYMLHRSQQNAADSAVVAGALKGSSGYVTEARAVASSYGYVNGSNNVTVTPDTPSCPAGAGVIAGTTCYRVRVSRNVPIYLSRIVGYSGDVALGAGRGKTITASAIAGTVNGTNPFCMIGLNSLKLAGGNGTNLTGCSLLSGSGGMQCSGTNSANGVTNAYTSGSFQGNATDCAPNPVSNYSGFSGDPLQTKVNNALSNLSCTYGAGGTITTLTGGGSNCFAGKVTLGGDITVNNANTVLVVQTNAAGVGGLDLAGHTIRTAGSGTLTIVFTGTTQINAPVLTGNGGTLNIGAPTSGDWQAMTIVEAPNMPNASHQGQTYNLDLSFSGGSNNITLDISGIMYAPNATVNINGSIDHASNGYRCIGIVANVVNTTGTNDIFSNPTSECRQYGNPLPTVPMIALIQ